MVWGLRSRRLLQWQLGGEIESERTECKTTFTVKLHKCFF